MVFKIPSEALTVIEIYTKTTTTCLLLTLLLVHLDHHKELGVQLEKSAFHKLITNNSFIWLICKTVPD
ncbi:hypothetical protein EB796_009389 [Bugula neritina]|uniref:Uncharacterized protein n=1 Tax=Bugula neritina TaxID=10212 RepID=A0A7J7K3X1_BUGNE|nr:hypothetical protein EB796_009389 [Bugula neritina]